MSPVTICTKLEKALDQWENGSQLKDVQWHKNLLQCDCSESAITDSRLRI